MNIIDRYIDKLDNVIIFKRYKVSEDKIPKITSSMAFVGVSRPLHAETGQVYIDILDPTKGTYIYDGTNWVKMLGGI
jgi:DNA-directed RNA polymerase subunit H (RpoH/RPB5)